MQDHSTRSSRRCLGRGGALAALGGGPTRRRGVAMLLIIVAIGVGTVLSISALSARENAPQIGQNAADGAAAAWAADAAARYAHAVLQTTLDWTKFTSGGVMLDDFGLAGAPVDVTVMTPSGTPAGPDDREVIVTATARVGQIARSVQRKLTMVSPVPAAEAVDARLGEFAAFASSSLRIDPGAIIGISPVSPERATTLPVRLGAGFVDAGSFIIDPGSTLRNVAIFVDTTASAALEAEAVSAGVADARRLPLDVPTVRDALPSAYTLLPIVEAANRTVGATIAETYTFPSSGRFARVTVTNGSTAVMNAANGSRYQLTGLSVTGSSVLQVVGDVELYVSGAVNITGRGCIELADASSSLTLYAASSVLVQDAAVGVSRDVARDGSRSARTLGAAQASSPARVRLRTVGTMIGPTIDITNNALVVATIHSPSSRTRVTNGSLIGRVTCAQLEVGSNGAIYYEPLLDSRCGYTADSGPLYLEDGTLRPEAEAFFLGLSPVVDAESLSLLMKNLVETLALAYPADVGAIDEGGPDTDDDGIPDDDEAPAGVPTVRYAWRANEEPLASNVVVIEDPAANEIVVPDPTTAPTNIGGGGGGATAQQAAVVPIN